MYDTFSMNLEKSTESEATSQKNFENLMATKTSERDTMTTTRTKKEEEKAAAEKELADAQQDLDDTQKQMKADVALFDNTKMVCTSKAAEWNERVRARTEELSGINKAIKPGKETFLQLKSVVTSTPNLVYQTLKRHA